MKLLADWNLAPQFVEEMFEEGHKLRGGPEIEFGKVGSPVDRAYLVEDQIVIRIWFFHHNLSHASAQEEQQSSGAKKGLKGGVVSEKYLGMEVPGDCKSVPIRLIVSQGCDEINLLHSERPLVYKGATRKVKLKIPALV